MLSENPARVQDLLHLRQAREWKEPCNWTGMVTTLTWNKLNSFQCVQVFCRLRGDRPKKSHLVVKVSLESSTGDLESDGLKVSSEDNLLYGDVVQDLTPSAAEKVRNKIMKEGDKAGHGFFYAIIPKDGATKKNGEYVIEIKINTSRLQPVEGW